MAGRADMAAPENVLALAMEAKHGLELLQSQVKQGMENVVSRLDTIGADQRDQSKSIKAVADQVSDMRTHSEGLERLSRLIERSTADWLTWRKEHESANQAVSDRVTRFSGAVWGFGLAVSLVLGLSAYIVTTQFSRVGNEIDKTAAELRNERREGAEFAATDRRLIRAEVMRLEGQVEELRKMRGLR